MTTLEPQFRHDYTVWRSMDSAPKTGPIVHVQLLMEDGSIVPDAHWAYGDGDGCMPPFGPAWFQPCGKSYHEISGKVRAWAPKT